MKIFVLVCAVAGLFEIVSIVFSYIRKINKRKNVVRPCHKCGQPWDGEHCDHE